VGQLSEESQEARNKDYKNYRIRFARKCSRVATMIDVFNRSLLSSDPYITHISLCSKKRVRKNIPDKINRLFVEPAIEEENQSEEDSEAESEDENEVEN
ncbi:hypothetical protein ALC62_12430, partial [Cyphomyrmex costatus]